MRFDSGPMLFIAIAAGAYLLGSIPFGLLLTRAAGLGDIRQIGSRSIGATNVLRTGSRWAALGTLLGDWLKGVVAVLLAGYFAGTPGIALAGLMAVIGHNYPFWLGFRGGKGVATGFGVLIAAAPLPGLLAGAIWLGMAAAVRISSVASLSAVLAAPMLSALFGVPFVIVITQVVIAGLIWQGHSANIARLLAGTEPRIGKGK
jgi:glycerol-3-phosphate acyltransferase PlsY